jgi:phosphoglycerate kinase
MYFQNIADLKLKGKKVFIRADLNVPLDEQGNIADDTRIKASLPTIIHSIQEGAFVMVTSHLGRPKEGSLNKNCSLGVVRKKLSHLLGKPVSLISNWVNEPFEVRRDEVFLLENCRCNVGEKNNDASLVNKMVKLCDVYVNDAFGTAHRAEATTYGLAIKAKESCAGFLMAAELNGLKKIYENPIKPFVAIVGGSKISTKLELLVSLLKKVDFLIVGGGIANTFLKAQGFEIGKSIVENDLIQVANDLIDMSLKGSGKICIPSDVIVAEHPKKGSNPRQVRVNDIGKNEMILDVGVKSSKMFEDLIMRAKTIIWNGPVGLFEIEEFSLGTGNLAKAIAKSSGYSAIGGGDTVAAVNKFGVSNKINYISTGGGAFLEYLQGMDLPAITSLSKKRVQL